MRPIDDAELRLFQQLIQRRAGIHLGDHKRALLAARLNKRLRSLGLGCYRTYYRYVSAAGNEDEIVRMLDEVCTNETRFFREDAQFAYLEKELLPEWRAAAGASRRPKRLRVWSAACSTGEEPYSLAMTFAWHLGDDWQVDIVASDLSTKALTAARDGLWAVEKSHQIPEAYLKRFMRKGRRTQAGRMAAGPEIRRMVRFTRFNLSCDPFPAAQSLDVIFCRNVLIYFDTAVKHRVVESLTRCLAPGGRLFLGQAEGLLGFGHPLRKVGPAVYAPL